MPKPTFTLWIRSVDRYVAALCGLSLHDLPDCPYRDWYDDGVTARSAASRAVKAAKSEYGFA